MSAAGINNHLKTGQGNQLMAALRRDPKRAGVLGVLLLVLAVLLLRALLAGGNTPAPVAGAPVPSALATPSMAGHSPDTSDLTPLSGRRATIDASLRQWLSQPVSTPSRNLFEVKLDYFPLEGGRPLALSPAGTSDFWDQLEKSLAWRADQRIKRETQIVAFMQEADQLRPTSTIPGPNPKAMINGMLVGEGDVVASFRVIKIEARRILVEREGIRLEIPMK
jgi:hypothetical protein